MSHFNTFISAEPKKTTFYDAYHGLKAKAIEYCGEMSERALEAVEAVTELNPTNKEQLRTEVEDLTNPEKGNSLTNPQHMDSMSDMELAMRNMDELVELLSTRKGRLKIHRYCDDRNFGRNPWENNKYPFSFKIDNPSRLGYALFVKWVYDKKMKKRLWEDVKESPYLFESNIPDDPRRHRKLNSHSLQIIYF